MEVNKTQAGNVVKIDPFWLRIVYFIMAALFLPMFFIILGWLMGFFWRCFLLGWNAHQF